MNRRDELKERMRRVRERPVEGMPEGFVARKLMTSGMREAALRTEPEDVHDMLIRHSIYLDGERFFDDDDDLSTIGMKEYCAFKKDALIVNGYGIKEEEDLSDFSEGGET